MPVMQPPRTLHHKVRSTISRLNDLSYGNHGYVIDDLAHFRVQI